MQRDPRLIVSIALLVFGTRGLAQEDLSVLKADADAPPAKMLNTYLQAQARQHFDARRQAVAALKTPEDVQKRQTELKAKFIEALGGFPERTPLRPVVAGKLQCDGYRIERVIYESRPSHHVTANLYLPEGKPPFPGVIMPIGHSGNGKAAEYVQRGCILLAKNGIAALAYDPIGQGERLQLLDSQGKIVSMSSTSEHTLVGTGALLVGTNVAAYRIWDGMRSLDYLTGRPEIDPKRLGCTGCSGGGTLTSYLMALDERILAAAPSCYITSLERLFATIGPQDGEQNITGQVAFGLEHADYLNLRAPRPTLICAASRDFFDLQGTWTTYREAKLVYGIMGYGERVDLFEYNTPHGYPKPQRQAIVRWMRRWLLEKDDAPIEEDFPIHKDQELWCTRTGQVLEDLKGRSAYQLNAEREKELAPRRAQYQSGHTPDDVRKEVRRLIALRASGTVRVKKAGAIQRDGYEVRKLIYETEPGIAVPALHFTSKGSAGGPIVLYVHGAGKAADARAGGPIEKLVKAGSQVIAFDVRGLGETSPTDKPSKWNDQFGADFKELYMALHLDRPLLGQRVHDVLAVAQTLALDPETAKNPVHIVGIGAGGPIALHAAALEPRIQQVTLERALLSWSLVARTPVTQNQLGNVVPNALKSYDLPDLAALVAPRPLTIRASLDAARQPVKQADLDEAYAACKTAYDKHKAAKQLSLQADK